MSKQEPLQELIIERNYLYRDSYRRIISFNVILVIIAICLTIILGYLIWQQKVPPYYASTTTGEVIELHPLSEPVISNSHLLEWASLVGRQAYTLSFLNYQDQLDQVKQYFAPAAYQKYINALNTSGVLDAIKNEKIIMQTVVMSTPTILYSGVLHGRFTWRIQMPILVTYGTASEQKQRQMSVTIDVSRVPVLDTPEGIQVTDFIVSTFKMS